MNTIWSDENRFSQEGYSAPTIFPIGSNYKDLSLYTIDLAKAEARQDSHLEWAWEQQEEARIEWLEYIAEIKAQREEYL